MKKHLFLIILTLITCFAGNLYAGTIDLLSSGYYSTTASWSSSYNPETKTITFSGGWGGHVWWVDDYDCSDWISITLTYETPSSGRGGIKCEYKEGSPSDSWVSINENGSNLTSATLTFAATNIKRVFVQLENAGNLVLTSAYVTTADPAEPFHQMITTGTSTNADGRGISDSGDGSTFTFTSVSDPIGNFDHNVLQVSYDMKNISDNDRSYKGRYLVRDVSYTTNTDATGYAFWYMTENSTDQIYMEIKEKDNSGYTFKLAATDGCWKYVYRAADHAHNGTSYEYEMWVNGKKDNFASGSNTGKFYFTEFQVTNVTSDDDVCSSCTAPNHVDISGNWDYFGGETIELTAQAYSSAGTGDPIDENNITGYQWKHNGVNIDGATSKTFTKTNCTSADGGDYSCVVSTGATCSTESSPMGTKVYVLQCYTGGETSYNFTRTGSSQAGTTTVTLSASTQYEFKIYAGSTASTDYHMGNNGTIDEDATNWDFEGGKNNVKLNSGLGGTFTFAIDYSANGGAPKVSVTYPRKRIYLNTGGNDLWSKDNVTKFGVYYFRQDASSGWSDLMTVYPCGSNIYYTEIPQWNGVKMNVVRLQDAATNANKSDWWTSYKHNQTNDCPISANDYITITGWNETNYTYETFSVPTFTVTYNANGDGAGNATGTTGSVPTDSNSPYDCGSDVTILGNTGSLAKVGYDFDGWNTAADGSGDPYAAGETLSNITANTVLYAQWAPKTTSVTLDANTANHGATGSSVTATWGTALPDFEAATGASGYALTGYFTDPTGGTKIINADGTLAASTTYTTADNKWNSELSALTLYPQYESSISPKTVPCSLGFYYTMVGTGTQDKVILDSDFSYSCNKDNAKNDQHNPNQEVCFSGSGHTLTSRMNVVFPQTGTYKFTFPLYIKESGNYDAPRVTVNGQQSAAATISTTGEENRNYETTLNVTAGTYTVSVWIGNTNEKVFFSTMNIESYQCRNIITTGAVGLFDSNQGSGGGASYICSSVADPECHFDHNVFCFSYSNMGGNIDNYYGCRLTSGPAYTPNAAATGFAFWYRTESSSDPVYMEFAGKTYNLEATDGAWHYTYVASSRAGSKSGEFDIWINGEKNGFSTTQSSGKIYLSELQATNVTSADPIAPATTHTITVASNNNTYGTVSSTPASGSSVTDCASITVTATPESGCSFVEWKNGGTQVSTEASYTFTMGDLNDGSNLTLTAYFQPDEFTISSLPWAGSQDLTGQTVVSAAAINSCFDSEITFTFTEGGTVSYYDNTDRETPLGTAVTSGTAITLNDSLRAHGIYIECTSGDATLTAVSKTTIGSVYQIWSGARSTLGAVAVGDWSEQVVLGPEHFQTAIVGDTLRVKTSNEYDGENGSPQGALQYILTDGDSHTYKGLDNSTSGGLYYWNLGDEEKARHYFEIPIDATRLDNLKRYGVIVKGRYYTIQSVELRASCSNRSMRTTAPDIITYGDDESINIMTGTLEFDDEGFNLGNWERKLELHENCFTSVTVGSVINFYMSVEGDATLSFRCNVDSIHAESYDDPPLCPSYGDISFDRTIDDLYGDAPAVVGATEGYKVLYLLVDADMLSRLQETGMILCGKGTLIKVVEGVEETVIVNPEDRKKVPTVVNNLEIHQGGEVTNTEDIEVLGKITYIRPAKDDGESYYKLGNKLDQWYTFALPFTVSDVEVLDTDGEWYDINAVYYSNDATDQATFNPDGAGHYYLQYLKAENETAIGRAFAARWQYITPTHSEYIHADTYNEDRYGYPKKDSAYIILFDRVHPIGPYFETNTQVRFVGGPQTIDGVAKKWKVEADGEQYWMYANNTLHSFTLTDAYILNDTGTEFVLQESPTIRPFECYVQATASLKEKCAAIPMRGFRIDNTTTGAESIQGSAIRAEKILRNGQLIIIRNGVEYDATGVVIR